MKSTQLTVHEDGTRSSWTMPYTGLGPAAPGASKPAPTPALVQAPRSKGDDFRFSEKVVFEDKHLNTVVGAIVRALQRHVVM